MTCTTMVSGSYKLDQWMALALGSKVNMKPPLLSESPKSENRQ